jgi:hypothetical protein
MLQVFDVYTYSSFYTKQWMSISIQWVWNRVLNRPYTTFTLNRMHVTDFKRNIWYTCLCKILRSQDVWKVTGNTERNHSFVAIFIWLRVLRGWTLNEFLLFNSKQKQTPCPESASELYRPSDHRFSAKLVPSSADRGVSRSQLGGSPTAVISVFWTSLFNSASCKIKRNWLDWALDSDRSLANWKVH